MKETEQNSYVENKWDKIYSVVYLILTPMLIIGLIVLCVITYQKKNCYYIEPDVTITKCAINDENHLIVTYSNNKAEDLGYVKGDKGESGVAGVAGQDGKDGTDGQDGKNGVDGKDGITPTINIDENGYWIINDVKTEVKAVGSNGKDGKDGEVKIVNTDWIDVNDDGYFFSYIQQSVLRVFKVRLCLDGYREFMVYDYLEYCDISANNALYRIPVVFTIKETNNNGLFDMASGVRQAYGSGDWDFTLANIIKYVDGFNIEYLESNPYYQSATELQELLK